MDILKWFYWWSENENSTIYALGRKIIDNIDNITIPCDEVMVASYEKPIKPLIVLKDAYRYLDPNGGTDKKLENCYYLMGSISKEVLGDCLAHMVRLHDTQYLLQDE